MADPIPKTLPCRECGIKPKRQIVSHGYTDKDDELFLVHNCGKKSVRFPEKGRFYDYMIAEQERRAIPAWNAEHGQVDRPKEGA